ncbi:MAG: TonB-dependent receptor [Calditrichaceae bacterium]|nr:TonB-dependent receptor [Calditrichaceae bacterium]MBN2708592.1 TonB-dependent receptor [Calditrichaceae bacterium]RQV95444.1 MAG: TonB-dependent receptor [Calditrichota bacterium]
MKKKSLKLCISFISLLLMISFSVAASGKIEGYVLDSQSGDALPGANVVIEGTGLGSATDMEGKFIIPQVPAGSYQLSVTYMGYQTKSVPVEVLEDETTTQVINLDFVSIEGEVIEVTAQAKGQMEAVNQQRASLQVTNVVSADRIQEVPDANAAESVGRLPGVSLKRSSGEGNEIVIRGLQPKMNLITVNGIRMPSTNEYNTAVGLAGISQYMLDGIEVRKSLTAQDDADVVGGIVDLKLATAPVGMHWNAIVDGMYNGLSDTYGSYRGSIQGSSRFFNDKLGVIGQFNIEKADRPNEALSAGYNHNYGRRDEWHHGIFLTNGNYQLNNIERNRFGFNVLMDYKLPKGKIQLNSIYNNFDEDRYERHFVFSVASGDIGVTKDFNVIDEESYSMVNGLSLESEIFGMIFFDFGANYTLGNRKRTNKALGFWIDPAGPEGIDAEFTDNVYGKNAYSIIPYINDIDVNWDLSRLYLEEAEFDENETTVQTNLKIPLTLSNKISGFVKFGGKMRFKDRDYDFGQDGDNGGIYGGDSDICDQIITDNPEFAWPWLWEDKPPGTNGVPAYPVYSGETDKILKDRFILKYYPKQNTVEQIVDRAKAANWASLDLWKTKAQDIYRDYDGDEKLYAGYLMAEFSWEKSVLLNAGVRYEKEETNYKGYGVKDWASAQDDLDTLGVAKRTNEFFLPSVTLRYNYADWGDVRIAYSQSLSRPGYYAFIPHYYADLRDSFSETAGNPQIKPMHSYNFDLIFSFYNNYIGLFTVGGFYKEMEDFVYEANFEVINDTLDNRKHAYNWFVPKGQYINVYSNLDRKSFVRGVEFDWQTRFWYLPSVLNGLVLGVNYSKISSDAYYYQAEKRSIPYDVDGDGTIWPWEVKEVRADSFQTRPLIDQPNDIFNISLGYDYKDFSMRLAYLFQGKVMTWKASDNELDNFTSNYSRLDLSIRQGLPLEGLSAQLLWSNITEEFEKAYTYEDFYNNNEQYYGSNIVLGIKYEF